MRGTFMVRTPPAEIACPAIITIDQMETPEITSEELQCLVAALVQLLPTLECPACCDQGHRYQYFELSATFYRDEWEWAQLSSALLQYQCRPAR